MTLQQFLLILRARYKIILFTLLATVTTTLLVSLLLPKQYSATTAIVLDVRSPDPVSGMVLPGLATPGYMATQIDIINSSRVAQRVVKMLRMDESPVIRSQWMDATDGKGDLNNWLGELLQKKLEVKPSRESNVINIKFSGSDPNFVAAVANTFAPAYIDVNLDLRVEPARQQASWFDGQTMILRERLEKAQKVLSDHQQKYGIVASNDRLDHETAKLNEISSQITTVQANTSDSSSKRKSLGNSETLTEVIQNPLIGSIKLDITRLDAALQESSINLGKNHPQTQRTESQLASLRSKLASEIRHIGNSIGTSYQVGKHREGELIESLEAQKKHVLELTKQHDAISVLKRDVELAQRTFEAASMRSNQVRLESQAVQTNIAVLNPAAVPTESSSPKILLNMMISIFLGILLSVGIALVFELTNRRVYSAEDLLQALDLPVLASIPSTALPPTVRGRLRGLLPRRIRVQALPAPAS
jgi:succinoglycan biosynthesis transport protein ExoP